MGLTRIRADQISNIDYKQAVRVITVANVTLSGGAPDTVDGVSLSAGDRILVTGQSTGSQNGIYVVSTVGTGSDGTWARSADGNENGEIEAGMIIMVTEGDVYKDTQWKLTTNNPIVIGTTALVFEQNSAFAFGNIYANGTAVLASSVGDALTLTPGDNIAITGNNTSKTVTIGVTGISLNSISNGTSNVNVISSGGNVTVGVGGTNNIAVFSTSGVDATGRVSASGNIIGGNLVTAGQANIADLVISGNVTGNLLPSANITYNLGSTDQRWNDLWLANSTIYIGNASISANATAITFTNPEGGVTVLSGANPEVAATTISAAGNIDGGNLRTTGLVSAAGTITGSTLLGTIGTAAQTGITSVGTLSSLSVSGNVQGGNLRTAGLISATGNVIGGNLQINNDAVITGNLTVNGNLTYINSNVVTINDKFINVANNAATGSEADGGGLGVGPVGSEYATLTYDNGANTWDTNIGISVTGIASATGNITGGNILTAGLISATGNITGGNILGNGAGLSGINVFSNVTVSGGNSAVANSIADTLTLTAGDGITIVADAGNNIVTIATAGTGESIFVTGGDMGTVDEAVTASEDLGLVTDTPAATEIDMGTIVTGGILYPDQLVLPSYTVAELGNLSAVPAGQFVFCSNESGGAIPAFSDGTNWRRVSDRAIVT